MDSSEKRVIGSLLFLLGLTILVVGFETGQLSSILGFLKEIFAAAIAGSP